MSLDAERIRSALRTRIIGRSLEVKARTGSTNDDAREAAQRAAPSGHVVVADAQDQGRGAHGRVWSSPGGTDLYVSILERRTLDMARLPWLTLAVGLGLRDAVARELPGSVQIKWPNDLLVDDKKCAGILVESSSTGMQVGPFVIGVGLDVNRSAFAPELAPIATSMRAAAGRDFDRNELLARVLGAVESRVDALYRGELDGLREAFSRHLAWVGASVRVDALEGVLVGLDPDGALAIETDAGRRSARSGTLRRV